ncbi:hypothetical protein FACS1894140_3590 [Spirochaetia bacterium]|nr:hypothetical protein FACS1894140_3590 [Spirochaetia bacterium]
MQSMTSRLPDKKTGNTRIIYPPPPLIRGLRTLFPLKGQGAAAHEQLRASYNVGADPRPL